VSIAFALGSFRNPVVARRAYGLILSKRIRAQDSHYLARAAVAWPDTRRVFVRWLQDNLPEVVDKYPGFTAARMLAAVGRLCDRPSRDAAAKAFEPMIKSLGRGERRLRQALERAQLCIELRERQAGSVAAYLQRRRW
jgi:hypothetical protein